MTQNCVVIDYGSGNLRSATQALQHVADRHTNIVVSNQAAVVKKADRVILPGVGAFADCRAGLQVYPGLWEAVEYHLFQNNTPFLGICVGMQLLADWGMEHGKSSGFGAVGGRVIKLHREQPGYKIPHMGWNQLTILQNDHPFFANLPPQPWVYFVHSYHFQNREQSDILAQAEYGEALTAVIGRDHIIGTQFHPEKSQAAGLQLLSNFLCWKV